MNAWSPQLDDPPAIARVLLIGLRRVTPALFDAAQRDSERPTRPIATALSVADDPSASLSVVGHDLRRGDHGARYALFLTLTGEARFSSGAVPVAGDVVLDIATGGILRLRLTQPIVA